MDLLKLRPMNIRWLDPANTEFPGPGRALRDPNGLLAVGGDLSRARLIAAYERGIFPWYEDGQPILWWTPNPRAVIYPERLHLSASLRKLLRKGSFTISLDMDFPAVVRQCRQLREHREGTWITDDMERAYHDLHLAGFGHSIEVWRDRQLVGGLYGICLGKVFYGESMFSLADNASKVAMVALAREMRHRGLELLDCQVSNRHLLSMGAELLPREKFNDLLVRLVQPPYAREPWAMPGGFLPADALL